MAYTRTTKEAVKQAYLNGRYPSIQAIADAFNIGRAATIHEWIRKEGWKKISKELVDAKVQHQDGKVKEMKDQQIHIRVTKEDKDKLKSDAKANGFDAISTFLMWLWRKFTNLSS